MLPDGWISKPLGECAKFISGGTPSKERADYWDGDFPWVTAKDMKTLWLADTGLRLSTAGKANAAIVPPGAVLVLTRGMTLLKDLPVGISKRELSFNQDIKALLPLAGMDGEFLAFQLLGRKKEVLELVDTAGHGTGRLDTEQLKQFQMNCPPHREQRAIAEVLCIWNAAIIKTETLLSNSRRQKQSLIARFLMPVPLGNRKRTAGDAFPPSVQPGIPQLPPTPKGWLKTTLGAHLKEVVRPANLDPTMIYRLVTVRRSRGGVDQRSELPGSDIKTPTQFYVKAGDFLVSKRQIVHGACGIVPPELDGAIVSNEYAILNTHGDLDPRFLRYLSETTYFQQTCFHSSIGVHIEKMLFRLDKWLKWPINLPPLDEQLRIVAILDAASAEVTKIQKQLDLLKEEKRALMADLLTGKRRVRVSDSMAEPEAA